MTTKAQHARWADLPNRRGWIAAECGSAAAARDGVHFSHVAETDRILADFAAAEELHAPGWLSVEDMRRELGKAR
ncbi:MAG: hypothetical protein KGR68_15320 [Betaproteobacteria bacterium]|nr:hypothetical protein [Betaproteobacteria bacterium]